MLISSRIVNTKDVFALQGLDSVDHMIMHSSTAKKYVYLCRPCKQEYRVLNQCVKQTNKCVAVQFAVFVMLTNYACIMYMRNMPLLYAKITS